MAHQERLSFLVTGGSGFVGLTLAKALADGQLTREGLYALEAGATLDQPNLTHTQTAQVFAPARHVVLLDVRPPPPSLAQSMPPSVQFVQGVP